MAAAILSTERKRGTRCCEPATPMRLDTAAAQQLSDDLQLLAHPIRLHILDLLLAREGEVCVCDLDTALPVKQPTISHHLKILRAAGLVDVARHGLWAYYTVRREALAALRERIAGRLAALD
jgi:ArsR family transcriptional regulator, arsenate/arsenite/antimonite-responsive transcriptional repressor